MVTKKTPKNAKIYICESCDFKCCKPYDYNRHVATQKHIMITTGTKKSAELVDNFACECGRVYKHRSGLCRHKVSCSYKMPYEDTKQENNSLIEYDSNAESNLAKVILELLRENKDFKNMLIEQHKTMIEIAQKTSITTNSNNTNSNNKQFNLNFFLNEQCKNAINLSEFVENVKLSLAELENVADMGYVDGVTQIFMNGLKDMDIYTRPLHCTDIKREIMHVRENNTWIKDTPDQAKIKSAIRRIAFRNIQQISEWNKLHPESEVLDTDEYNRAFQIMKESLGDTCPGGVEKNNERVLKNVMKAVYIDKQDLVAQPSSDVQ
jgi:hypothetical protein